jgi:hypothetical protein
LVGSSILSAGTKLNSGRGRRKNRHNRSRFIRDLTLPAATRQTLLSERKHLKVVSARWLRRIALATLFVAVAFTLAVLILMKP